MTDVFLNTIALHFQVVGVQVNMNYGNHCYKCRIVLNTHLHVEQSILYVESGSRCQVVRDDLLWSHSLWRGSLKIEANKINVLKKKKNQKYNSCKIVDVSIFIQCLAKCTTICCTAYSCCMNKVMS